MPKLYFIRHGETIANTEGILTGRLETDLTEKGIEDAINFGKSLNEQFDYFYCSPLNRTKQTLELIVGKVDVTIDERLTEIYSGDWQGKLKKDIPEKEYDLYKVGLFNPPNGETIEHVKNRIMSFLNDMFNNYNDNDKVLIVTHNGFIRNLKGLFNYNSSNDIKNLEMFVVDNSMLESIKLLINR